jgi:adenylate kinase
MWIQSSGKWTQSQKLLKHFGKVLKYFETGGILRSLQSTDNVIWNYLKEITANGLLVKSWVVSGLFSVFLETLEPWDTVLADGCLRQMWQTKSIVEELKKRNRDFVVIDLILPDDVIYKRLENRLTCKKCGKNFSILLSWDIKKCTECGGEIYRRNDDENTKSIQNRIAVYKSEALPAIEFLDKQWYVVKIDATQSVDEIFKQILEVVDK